MLSQIFHGCIPALMTPCLEDRSINYPVLVRKTQELMQQGMTGVVYCGSMGDSDYQLQINPKDELSPSQKEFARAQLTQFQSWWNNWLGKNYTSAQLELETIPT